MSTEPFEVRESDPGVQEAIEESRQAKSPEKPEAETGEENPKAPGAEGDKAETPEGDSKESEEASQDTEEKAEGEGEESSFSLEKFRNEFAEKGELSEDSYGELEKAGIPRALVDQYIADRKAEAERSRESYEAAAFEKTGGKDGYEQMVRWARANADREEIAAFNEAVNSGDTAKMTEAVTNLHAKYQDAVGSEPQTVVVNDGEAVEGGYFSSPEEHAQAVRDPRYKTSPKYREEVARKLARSNLYAVRY